MAEPFRYQTNGALPADSPAYIPRSADREILGHLRAGEYCYVLAPRQMGKSSLLWQTVERLKQEGVLVAIANIQVLGDCRSEPQFYEGVVEALATSAEMHNPDFQMPFEWRTWWEQQSGSLPQRFVSFLRTAFLGAAPGARGWVIAIDEIDTTISLPFTDSFFTAIRSCFDARPDEPAMRRLSFILLGVATPDSLIKDRTRTPFNVGRQVTLRGFTEAEAEPLAEGLPIPPPLQREVLQRVLFWTGGQPHLTQDTCNALAEQWGSGAPPQDVEEAARQVDELVRQRYLDWQSRGANPHFDYIELRMRGFPRKGQLLRAYGQALGDGGLQDSRESGIVAELKIVGLVRPQGQGRLVVDNRIYREVFNQGWVRRNIPANVARRTAIVALTLLLLAPLVWIASLKPAPYIAYLQKAEALSTVDYNLARENYEALRSIPFRAGQADQLWGELNRRRLKSATELDRITFRSAVPERQDEAEAIAKETCKALAELPQREWTDLATSGWDEFQTKRLQEAIRLDDEAFDTQASGVIPESQPVVDVAAQRHQHAHQYAVRASTSPHEAETQRHAKALLARFFSQRAERSEYAERLEEGGLWRLRSLTVDDQPATRQAVSQLLDEDYSSLRRTWRSRDDRLID